MYQKVDATGHRVRFTVPACSGQALCTSRSRRAGGNLNRIKEASLCTIVTKLLLIRDHLSLLCRAQNAHIVSVVANGGRIACRRWKRTSRIFVKSCTASPDAVLSNECPRWSNAPRTGSQRKPEWPKTAQQCWRTWFNILPSEINIGLGLL